MTIIFINEVVMVININKFGINKILKFLLLLFIFSIIQFIHTYEARAKIPFFDYGNDDEGKKGLTTLAPMLKNTLPAVVNISVTDTVKVQSNPFFNDPLFKRFFEEFHPNFKQPQPRQQEKKVKTTGSGVIIDAEKGYIITNHHVIENAEEIFVLLHDKRKLAAKLIGADPDTDIALLQVAERDLIAIPLGNSDKLEVGDFIVAIGNPFGLKHTVTFGIVSALGRNNLGIENYENFIQVDASINPGNSGGALVNLNGELVGINTAIISHVGGNIGIGFAIPIDMAKLVVDQLAEHGEVSRGQLGIHIQDMDEKLAKVMGLDFNHGVIITKVVAGSSSEAAGLKSGDVIITVDGKKIDNTRNLRNIVGLKQVDEVVELEIIRNGKELNIKVNIAGKDKNKGISSVDVAILQGAYFTAIDENHPLYKKVKKGIIVNKVDLGSSAWNAGLRDGDIIISVNQESISSITELEKAAKKVSKGIYMNILRGDSALFIVIN